MIGIEPVMADLRARGVTFQDDDFGEGFRTVDGLLATQMAKACWFLDSEGNTFELNEVDR